MTTGKMYREHSLEGRHTEVVTSLNISDAYQDYESHVWCTGNLGHHTKTKTSFFADACILW